MIRHIVLYWLKEKENDALMEETVAKLNSMRGKIPGLVRLHAGRDTAHTPRSCDVCLSMVFETAQDLEAYRTHPAHLPVQAHMHAVMERSASADFEVDDP